MKQRKSRRAKRWWDIVHLGSGVGWFGVALCQLVLNVISRVTADAGLRQAAHKIGHTLDIWLLIPLVLLALVSGVVLAWRSNWGVFRHWWIVVKLVATLALMTFSAIWLGGWIGTAVELALTTPPDYFEVRNKLLAGSIFNNVSILLMVVISVFKPWGRIRQVTPG
ncbi:hypothetical protein N8J89_35110 [Crossiella sp. CA-258035]|uniref:hypothetical protein n=1 Tax=Crossiella sp. CA-258035 TaxID=2981138 RepID=UPI0024BCD994|nr:hypothetical protein [Crossiella sp. CA-258035]WHT18288.1 hypothetical protein N8J89_35110 [Crossiella sp. CA-258035]